PPTDAHAELGRRRLAGLPAKQSSELALGTDERRTLPALQAVHFHIGDLAHRELTVHVGGKPGEDLRAVHCSPSLTYPCSRANRPSARRSSARPRDNRDITVPIGHPSTSVTSRYVSPSMSTRTTASRNDNGSVPSARSMSPWSVVCRNRSSGFSSP